MPVPTSRLLAALRAAQGNQSAAARAIGISRQRVGQMVAALTDEEFAALSPFRDAKPDRTAHMLTVRLSREEHARVLRDAKRARLSVADHARARLLAG